MNLHDPMVPLGGQQRLNAKVGIRTNCSLERVIPETEVLLCTHSLNADAAPPSDRFIHALRICAHASASGHELDASGTDV